MSRRSLAFTVAAFLTLAATACDTPARSTAPELPRYDSQQAPPNAPDGTSLPAGTESDSTGRGIGYLGSGQ